jgi:uncharacterized protein (TIGR02246 family)
MDRATVQQWLNAYVQAWLTYDPQQIGALFAEDAVYRYSPYQEPLIGRDAIVASWLENRDAAGTYQAHYEPLAVDGDVAIAHGRSNYFEADGATSKDEFDNIFVIRFNTDGLCADFGEWYMRRPKQ